MTETMYKACIFDLDGTLTDTLESLTFSVNETMKAIGFPEITQEQCRQFVGNGAKVLIEKHTGASLTTTAPIAWRLMTACRNF